ncbi:hypothetical protein ACQKP0_00390 [Heyndrickxia sp. NPDC080065]|uniref:hypothetical protein n=1 Tax=Heyndrickxia sp. NPDC080065 TaxID=3390568 RepID=UPI003D06829F
MNKIALYILPAIIILIVGYVSFTDVLFQQTDHKYFFISLLIIYPAIFLIHGVITAILKGNIYISLGISTLGFLITILIWANSSAIGYILVYLLLGFLGYGAVLFFQKGK